MEAPEGFEGEGLCARDPHGMLIHLSDRPADSELSETAPFEINAPGRIVRKRRSAILPRSAYPPARPLLLRCYVNGALRQSNNTGNMIHSLWEQIEYLSTAFTLETGNLIATGTPEVVGVGMEPPSFLAVGDIVRCEIDSIGSIENEVVWRRPALRASASSPSPACRPSPPGGIWRPDRARL